LSQEWKKLGVSAGHIDAETTDEERRQMFADHRAGDLSVICSQGVLREGADLPWVTHGILCQPCNGLGTYLQIVGRLLRAWPGKEKCILQDHAGAWRHGSPNEDRLVADDTDESLAKERKAGFEKGDGQGADPLPEVRRHPQGRAEVPPLRPPAHTERSGGADVQRRT
jgi:superfamily II DNA or RNA helicase